jgi:hypothetical protein
MKLDHLGRGKMVVGKFSPYAHRLVGAVKQLPGIGVGAPQVRWLFARNFISTLE